MKERIVIIGAGISGLSIGWKLGEAGKEVTIFEQGDVVGGLAATINKDGYLLDFGPHSFFSEDTDILNTVLDLFENKLAEQPRRVKFYYEGKYLDYPLTPFNVLFQMGIASGIRATLSFLKSKIILKKTVAVNEDEETVEDWAIASFGRHLYRTFFKPYTEQFWKVPCRELSSRSIPTHTRMSFINTCRMLLRRRVTKDNDSLIEREALPTYYPGRGFGEISEKIGERLRKNGGTINLNCKVTSISRLPDGRLEISYEENGREKNIEASHIISTIPLNLLALMLKPFVPQSVIDSADKLSYQGLIVLGLITEKQNILNCHYMYMMNRLYNRISEMNKFSPFTSKPGENILALEFTCNEKNALWKATKEELFELSIGTLEEDGFISKEDVKSLIMIKAPHAYPIYRKDYARHLKRLLDHVDSFGDITVLGRSGEFIYMDVDKCIRKAFDRAKELLKRRKNETSHTPDITLREGPYASV